MMVRGNLIYVKSNSNFFPAKPAAPPAKHARIYRSLGYIMMDLLGLLYDKSAAIKKNPNEIKIYALL